MKKLLIFGLILCLTGCKSENEGNYTPKQETVENDFRITYERYTLECEMVEFEKVAKEITFADDNCEVVIITRKVLQAINKQVEELGWNNE